MSIATIEVQPRVKKVEFTNDMLSVTIEDGRIMRLSTGYQKENLQATDY